MPICRNIFGIGLALLVLGIAAGARADSYSPAQARSVCQSEGANTPQKLRSCCDENILDDPPIRQKRLVEECVTGVKQEKSADEKALEAKEKERRKAEQAERAANPSMKASKSQAGGAMARPVPSASPSDNSTNEHSPEAAAATAGQASSPAKGSPDCGSVQGSNVLAQLGDLARKMGRSVPATGCPPTRP